MNKWFDQYCKLNRLDMDMILDKIRPQAKKHDYYHDIYTSIVYEWPLSMEQVQSVIDRFQSGRDKRVVNRLIEKLERLHSQS